jgi:acylphosphatase
MTFCRRFLISGRVQGVFFRATTEAVARRLGVTGWVRNLPDGRVEVLACGEEAKLGELEQWLRQGPPRAQVERVVAQDAAVQAFNGFSARP